MFSHNSQQQPLNSNQNRSILQGDRDPYDNFRRGINNRTITLKSPSPAMPKLNMVNRFHHFLYSMPEVPKSCHGNGHFTSQTHQATQTRGHAHFTTPFRMTNTSHEQQGLNYRGSLRSNGLLYSTFPCKCYTDGLHNSNITTKCLEAIPFGQTSSLFYEGSL